MQVIISHVNLDFDGLASMVAARKLYPKAKLVLPAKQGKAVERFLAIYRDSLDLYQANKINWDAVTKIILVDTASLKRVGDIASYINKEKVQFIVYDHHQITEDNVHAEKATIENVGATITLILEEIEAKGLLISPFEATIFALGLYTDTGSFTYLSTTARDLQAGSYLVENGANLQVVLRFCDSPMQEDEQQLLHSLINNSEEYYVEGVDIIVAFHQQKQYIGGLAFLARKALEMTGTDAIVFVVEMGKRIFIVGRSTTDRVDILPLIKQLGGGGHQKAAAAMVKHGNFDEVLATVKKHIYEAVRPALTAKDIMSSPVKVISTQTTIADAGKMMLRYGHTGFPVLDNGNLVGIISRRDVDKAKHHGLGHAPVKGYMSTNPITISSSISLEEVQHLMIEKNVGRLPVLENNDIVGIISRTNVIEAIHGDTFVNNHRPAKPIEICLIERMNELLTIEILHLLKIIGKQADELNYSAFLIGGVVRDLVIGRTNEDIDIVVEGDGIKFAHLLAEQLGGSVRCHEKFGTATWKHPSLLKIDISSARTEYYDYPAALPTVEMSSLKEDLFRRDFTINAMAIQINNDYFGKLMDYFHGYDDIEKRQIKILYNLSFVEDPTRILRAVRFEQRFGFKMDQQTLELALISADKIISTSKPRIAHELNILLSEDHPIEALERLNELGIIRFLFGENSFDKHTLERFKSLVDEANPLLQEGSKENELPICYLMLLSSKKEDNEQLLKDYALNSDSLKVIGEIIELINNENELSLDKNLGNIHCSLKKYQVVSILCFVVLKQLPQPKIKLIKAYLYKRHSIPKLVDGNDLIRLNLKPGPLYSKILLQLECDYMNNELSSREEALEKIKQYYL